MASVQEVIASFDPERIKQRRTACKRMLSVCKTQLELKLVKVGDSFDHSKISRQKVLDDISKVRKYYREFEDLHVAYLSSMHESENSEEENRVLDREEKYYTDVCNLAQNLIELYDNYETSFKLHEIALPDPV